MANGNQQLSLEILIKTIADGQGIQATEQGIKQVAAEFEKAAQAGKPLEITADAIKEKLAEVGTAAKSVEPVAETIDEMAQSFADANSKGAEFGDTIGKLTNDQLLALEEKLRVDIKAANELGQSTTALKGKLNEVYTARTSGLENGLNAVGQAGQNAAPQIDKLSRQVGSLKTAAGGAQQVMNGLSQGGIGGLVTAGRGAITTVTALATSALGATLIPVLGAAAVAFFALGRSIEKNQKQIKDWYDEGKKSSDARKQQTEELKAATDAALTAEAKKVEALQKSYSELNAQITEVRQRVDEINKLQTGLKIAKVDQKEAQDLAALQKERATKQGARVTPLTEDQQAREDQEFDRRRSTITTKAEGDRQAVRTDDARTDILNQKLNAQQDITNAEKALSERQALVDSRQKIADELRRAAEVARLSLESIKKSRIEFNGPLGRERRQEAAATAAASKDADQKLADARAPIDDLTKDIEARKRAAQLLEERTGIEEETNAAAREQRDAAAEGAFAEKNAALQAKLKADISAQQSALKTGDKAAGTKASADRLADTKALDALNAEESARLQRVIDDARLDAQTRTTAAEKKIAEIKEAEAIQAALNFATKTRKDAATRGDSAGAAQAADTVTDLENQLNRAPGAPAAIKRSDTVGTIQAAPEPSSPAQTLPNAPTRATNTPLPSPLPNVDTPPLGSSPAIQQGLGEIASTIQAAPKAEPIDVSGVTTAFGQFAQSNTEAHLTSQQRLAMLEKQIAQQAFQLSSLGKGQRALAENAQS